jgi:hypothetical protein
MTSIVGAQSVSNTAPEVAIRYVGALREKPVFRLEYTTQSRNSVEVSISDEAGRLLYSDKFLQPSYTKNFQVDADAHENFTLILTLIETNVDTKERKRQSYSINGKVDVMPDFGVTKL